MQNLSQIPTLLPQSGTTLGTTVLLQSVPQVYRLGGNSINSLLLDSLRYNYTTYSDQNLKNIKEYLVETERDAKAKTTTTRRPRTTGRTPAPRETTKRRKRSTTVTPTPGYTPSLKPVDAGWILLSGILIFTMQTGFGLLEAGIVSLKNETNIMLKNIADIVFGGFTYWIFGYGITYGTWRGSSSIFGFGLYAVDADIPGMGDLFTNFFFQLSFATTATTIVSGAVAERCNYKAYCLYSFVATVTYCVAARWVWGPDGWLQRLGAIDIAGSGVVHLTGGAAALVAAWFIGPRLGRFETGPPPWGNPTGAFIGTLTLWWAWLAFNAGSTFGLTQGLWKFAARACVTTMVASIAGGMIGMLWAFIKPGKVFEPGIPVNAILGALVSVTAGCAIMHTPEAFGAGAIGAVLVLLGDQLTQLAKIDDAVGATAVHGVGGIWGLMAVGIFAEDDEGILGVTREQAGLVRLGGWYLLGVQTLTAVSLLAWSMVSTFVIFFFINLIIPFRVNAEEELLGMDFIEHGIRRRGIGVSPTISLFQSSSEVREIKESMLADTGKNNPGHEQMVGLLKAAREAKTGRRTGRQKPRFKAAGQFARAFRKLQAKGRRISPRDRQYILDDYASPLKSSLGSVRNNQRSGRSINSVNKNAKQGGRLGLGDTVRSQESKNARNVAQQQPNGLGSNGAQAAILPNSATKNVPISGNNSVASSKKNGFLYIP